MEARRLNTIRNLLAMNQAKSLERVIDELSRYKLENTTEIMDVVIELAKQDKLKLIKTNDGFKYTTEYVTRKKTTEAEQIQKQEEQWLEDI